MYLWLFKHQDKREKPMYKNGKYRETDKMSDLICENYPMVLVMSRFGIALGFGEKNIGEVCRQNGVDPCMRRLAEVLNAKQLRAVPKQAAE